MARLKRTQFWGEDGDEVDDRLIRQFISGEKTATACPASIYFDPDGEYEDGGIEVGDLVEVCDSKGTLRCIIRITEYYNTEFGKIPEKLWCGEGNSSAQEFQEDHIYCWLDFDVNNQFKMAINHFELVEVITP